MSTRNGFVFRQIKYPSTYILQNHETDSVSLSFDHLSSMLQRMEFYTVIETTSNIGTIVSLQQGTYSHDYSSQVLCSFWRRILVIRITKTTSYNVLIPVAARSKVWVCGRSLTGIMVSNPAGGECCVLSGRGRFYGLITRPEQSYRVWCVWMWLWIPDNGEVWPTGSCCTMVKNLL